MTTHKKQKKLSFFVVDRAGLLRDCSSLPDQGQGVKTIAGVDFEFSWEAESEPENPEDIINEIDIYYRVTATPEAFLVFTMTHLANIHRIIDQQMITDDVDELANWFYIIDQIIRRLNYEDILP